MKSQRDVSILIAEGFDEGFVNRCVGEMREAGLAVSLVSLSTGLVKSLHGVTTKADLALSRWRPLSDRRLVVLPGSDRCIESLACDPRVRRMVKEAIESDGWVAAMVSAESTVKKRVLPRQIDESQYLPQKHLQDRPFIQSLIDHVLD